MPSPLNTLAREWSSLYKERYCIYWLAQCRRRLTFPIESFERYGLIAFEYAWKAFERLYGPFSGRTAREKIEQCLEAYLLDRRGFLTNAYNDLQVLCQKSGTVKDWFSKPQQRDRISKQAQALSEALRTGDDSDIPGQLAYLLYTFRNARIHGDREVATLAIWEKREERTLGGSEFPSVLTEVIYKLDIYLFSSMLGLSPTELEELVEAETQKIIEEIRSHVGSKVPVRRLPRALVDVIIAMANTPPFASDVHQEAVIPAQLVLTHPQGETWWPNPILLSNKLVTIGRDPAGNSVVLSSPFISRQHALIISWEDGYSVCDLGSTAGTYVNYQLCPDGCTLQDGDLVTIGPVNYTFLAERRRRADH